MESNMSSSKAKIAACKLVLSELEKKIPELVKKQESAKTYREHGEAFETRSDVQASIRIIQAMIDELES